MIRADAGRQPRMTRSHSTEGSVFMFQWLRRHTVVAIIPLVVIPFLLALQFLSSYAPRDWSLHWLQPKTVISSTSSDDYSSVMTPQGYDLLWTSPANRLYLSRLDHAGRRLGPDVALAGSSQSPTLGVSGSTVVAAWRQDVNGGSRLDAAVIQAGKAPRYLTLASGPWPLEHPLAFSDGPDVGIVFSWQRTGPYNVFLSRVGPGHPSDTRAAPQRGTRARPVQLTHVSSYAFYPHAVLDAAGNIQIIYLQACCGGGFRLVHDRFSLAGRPLGSERSLGVITSMGGGGQSGTPASWGLDVVAQGTRVWVTWAGDQGLMDAAFDSRGRLVLPPTLAAPLQTTFHLAFTVAGGHRELVWEQPYELGVYLGTIPVGANGLPPAGAKPDRVAFESVSAALPQPLRLGGKPAVLYQANPSQTDVYRIEVSRFSPRVLAAPSVWAKLGLGLGSPVVNLAVLLVAALAFGVLITVANFLILIVLILAYFVIARLTPASWKWFVYTAVLIAALFLLFVRPGAPSPPLLFVTALPYNLGLLSIAGMAVFIIVLAWTILRRLDDVYRAAVMAFVAIYFIAFLEAITLVQGTVAKI